MLAVVSHDLQNLLNAIGLNLTVLLRTPAVTAAERRMRQCGEVVERSLGTMKRLLRDILEAQRIESAQFQVALAPEEVIGLVRESVELMEPLAAEKKIRLRVRLDRQSAQVLCERERIQQVLHNLVGNAIHYTPDGREVVVRVGATATRCSSRSPMADRVSPPSSCPSCSTATGGAGAPRATASASACSSSTG